LQKKPPSGGFLMPGSENLPATHKNLLFFKILLYLRIVLIYNTAMIVCICHRVSDREITRHARAGMSFDDIQLELGVATQCGQCEGCARDIHSQCQTSTPQAHCHKAEVSNEAPATALPQVAQIQLAQSILESRLWKQSLPLQAVLSLP
jgi:bacterioferritin-associated ferredoxin